MTKKEDKSKRVRVEVTHTTHELKAPFIPREVAQGKPKRVRVEVTYTTHELKGTGHRS